jgi:hypothetical protein
MSTPAVPTAILALGEQFCRGLQALGSGSVDASLADLEAAVLQLLRGLAPQALALAVRTTQRSLGPARAKRPVACPRCGSATRVASWRSRTLLTTCGPLNFERPWHHCAACRHGFSPTDASLALCPGQRISPALVEQVTAVGATTSFREATDLLGQLTGITLHPETVRRVTEATGAALEAAEQAVVQRVAATREPAAPPDPAPGRLVVETDGVMVRYRDGWHEVKVGLAAGWENGKLRAPSYTAARLDAGRFGLRLLALAAHRGALEVVAWEGSPLQRRLARLRPVVVLGDGAHWIWDLAAEQFGERTEVVDWYHASEHVWAAAKALCGEGDAARRWAEDRLAELWDGGAASVVAALARAHPSSEEANAVVRRERGYFTANAERMAYAALRTQGLPCGSGGVESSAKHLVQQRLKRAGSRWSEPGAQALLTLRCHRASRRAHAA